MQTFGYNSTTLLLARAGNCVDVHAGGPIVWMRAHIRKVRLRKVGAADASPAIAARFPRCR
jgi:hypothetical protein